MAKEGEAFLQQVWRYVRKAVHVSTPISTTFRQASRWGDAPTLNPAKTARASLESAFLCTVCQGKGAGRGAEGKRLL